MLRLTILIFLALIVPAMSEGPAGIVLYFKSGGEIYLLLADHARGRDEGRGWASFGGACKDQESAQETAARETEEETLGFFKRDWLLQKIKGQPPVRDGVFSCFFLEVDFVPIPRITTSRPSTSEPDFFERGPYAWVPFSVIAPHLEGDSSPNAKTIIPPEYLPSEKQTNWFWSIWLQNLRIARQSGMFPWAHAAGVTALKPAGAAK